MEMMYLLIPGTLFFLGLTIKIFYWAVNSGQFDDLETEGHRILFDDDVPQEKTAVKTPDAEVAVSAAAPEATVPGAVAPDRRSPDTVVNSTRQ